MHTQIKQPPQAVGLYDPRYEHDACGVGMVARLDNQPTHDVIVKAIAALENLEHRGANGADPLTGDGAGILMQMPDELLRAVVDFELPPLGQYGVLMCFLPTEQTARAEAEALLERTVEAEGQRLLGWRDVPVDASHTGEVAGASRPEIRQLFVGAGAAQLGDEDAFERKLYVIRRICELTPGAPGAYIASSSSRTLNYKGMLISFQLAAFYPDLRDERAKSALALVHSRFSTNTFPSWELAHPYRVICHNGEINTVRGNVNWMRARESELRSELFGEDLRQDPAGRQRRQLRLGDVRQRDRAADARRPLTAARGDDDDPRGLSRPRRPAGRPEGLLRVPLLPDGAVGRTRVGRVHRRARRRRDARPQRPAPRALGRDDRRPRRARLGDRAARHPARAGAPARPPAAGQAVPRRPRAGRIVDDEEVKREVSTVRPYRQWYEQSAVPFSALEPSDQVTISDQPLRTRQRAFGYSQEDLRVLLAPMARDGAEPVGSMGNDLSLAVLSDQAPPLFSYFKQLFAQVTNPPIDPIREEIVMSLATTLGSERNLFEETPEHAHKLVLDQPILLNRELETLRHVSHDVFAARTINITWSREEGAAGIRDALARICRESSEAIAERVNIIVLSDRLVGPRRVPVPSLLAVAAVHHHLVREGTRLRAGIILESGEPREVHHFATLIGYGAVAINPYLLLETLDDLVFNQQAIKRVVDGEEVAVGPVEAAENLVKALGKALLKTISKMGISTIQSYCGAQIFEAVGLEPELIDKHFTGTASRIGGVGVEVLAEEALERHARAYPVPHDQLLPVGGVYAWRRDGEHHQWNPETIALVQHAVRAANGDVKAALGGDASALETVRGSAAFEKYREYAQKINEDAARKATLRGLLKIDTGGREPVALEQVEPAAEIVKRFCTGAMSLGSISREAHETLAIAMNRLGGRSNTGEGGEDPSRFTPDANGDRRRSAIKQVASGRFGVTIHYLVNADELQIKMAQGAKPGEGGQLPGHKVDDYIGSIRHTTPGVGLISPPPHHDIYSIEDLKQLIYDLRCGNPEAEVSVKLVSEVGVGTVAAGVSKANADRVLIAGHDGGTGASPLSSIQSAGVPWEIGLAETQQTLLLNDLRSRIKVQTDGQLKTGRDVVIAAMLGADEMGFSTAPLIATGCIMMRACHLNTCPVGIATQDPELRKRFKGTPEHVVNFFFFIAEEVREILASLGLRTLDEAIGRTDLLSSREAIDHWKARGVDLTHILTHIELPPEAPRHRVEPPPAVLEDALDWELLERAAPALRERDGPDDRRRSGQDRAADPQPQPLRRRDPLEPDRARSRRRRPAGRVDRGRVRRLGRAELRRLAGAGRDLQPARRRQRLRRQGPVGRRRLGAPARGHGRALRCRAQRDRRQHRAVWRDARTRLLPRPGR